MTERPIIFSSPMVRALLAGTKTQTRRVVKPQPDDHHWQLLPGYELKRSQVVTADGRVAVKFVHTIPYNPATDAATRWACCPYGAPGDHLYVRETFIERSGDLFYRADGEAQADSAYWICFGEHIKRWTPAIHMPRAASRITLEITGVSVERLQDISDDDVLAEGTPGAWVDYREEGGGFKPNINGPQARQFFYRKLWQEINGPGSWDANPWVWVIEFRRVS